MTEAEVILRLAVHYMSNGFTKETVTVSIDGAHVKTGNTVHFDIFGFLREIGLRKVDTEPERWQGTYSYDEGDGLLVISSTPGIGDVNIKLLDGQVIYAECKKGKNDKRGQEYPLMREAIGQLMTGCDFVDGVIPMVAVPLTDKSKTLAERWSKLTQINNLGIKFALISEDGNVEVI